MKTTPKTRPAKVGQNWSQRRLNCTKREITFRNAFEIPFRVSKIFCGVTWRRIEVYRRVHLFFTNLRTFLIAKTSLIRFFLTRYALLLKIVSLPPSLTWGDKNVLL